MNKFRTTIMGLSLCFFSLSAFAGFQFDASYWRISSAKTSFDEKISEASDRGEFGSFGGVESGRPVWEIESDASKYMFGLSYTFDDYLYRLTAGVQYAGSGSNKVKKVSWGTQYEDFEALITNKDFSADEMEYTNAYLSYRLFPFASDSDSSNSVKNRGLDLLAAWIQFDQSYGVTRYFDRDNNEIRRADVLLMTDEQKRGIRSWPVEFTTSTSSIGLGVGGEDSGFNGLLSFKGRIIYLPFFDYPGSGWDAEFKISYALTDYLSIFVGGKFFKLEVDAEQTIANIAQIPGFSTSEATFKGLSVDLKGYMIGVSLTF